MSNPVNNPQWDLGTGPGIAEFLECARGTHGVPGEEDDPGKYLEDHSYFCKFCQAHMKFCIVERVDEHVAVGRLEELH